MESSKLIRIIYITPELRCDIVPLKWSYFNKKYKSKNLRIGRAYKWLFIRINYEKY